MLTDNPPVTFGDSPLYTRGPLTCASLLARGVGDAAPYKMSSDFCGSIFYMAKNLPFTATTASRQKIRLTVANTATTFFSLQPHISK